MTKCEGTEYKYKTKWTTTNNHLIIYSQIIEDKTTRNQITTHWCHSGDWTVYGEMGIMSFAHRDSRESPSRFNIEEVAEIYQTGDFSQIFGFREDYRIELSGHCQDFLNDCIQELVDE